MVMHSPYPDLVIPEVPLHEYILKKIQNYGDDIAMVDYTRGESITFRQVHDQIRRCASALYKRGMRKGDVVAICSSNRVEYAIIILAAAACGGISTTCNPVYQKAEILQQFRLSKPNIVFCDSEAFQRMRDIAEDLPTLREVYTFGETQGSISYNTLVHNDDGKDFPRVQIDTKEDLLLLPYSSGTTGLPKGVMLTHHNLMAQMILTVVVFYQTRCSSYYMVVPMFHTFGYSMTLYMLMQGTKNVFDSRFEVERLLKALETHKVTHFSAVPPIMLKLAQTDLDKKYDLSSLQRMVSGAAPTAPSLITEIQEKYNILVTQSYGMTEMVPLAMADPLVKKLNSVGNIAPNTIIKVIDIETGKELGIGEDGEIVAKGPQMMKGYLQNPDATARTIDLEGWIHTGDIGHYDENGMLYVVDRLKELIKYKGFQVAPAELEALLLTHPDILDAAVIGVPHPDAGEVPKAFIVKRDAALTAEDVEWFVAKELAHYKKLRGGVEFLETIPKSPSGKILRRELRKLPIVRFRM
ncbi:uncharacterized protein LOC120337870 [Styela clava]